MTDVTVLPAAGGGEPLSTRAAHLPRLGALVIARLTQGASHVREERPAEAAVRGAAVLRVHRPRARPAGPARGAGGLRRWRRTDDRRRDRTRVLRHRRR